MCGFLLTSLVIAGPAAAQVSGDLEAECPEGTSLEGEGRNLTCVDISVTRVDALVDSDGDLSCRDGSTGSPTADDPFCESTVRNSIPVTLICNGETVDEPGDGDACGVDSDGDGVVDGQDPTPFTPGSGADTAPTPQGDLEASEPTDTDAPTDDVGTDVGSDADEPAPGDSDPSEPTDSEPDGTGDDTDADGESDGGSSLGILALAGLAIVFIALAIWLLRQRARSGSHHDEAPRQSGDW